MGRTLYVAFKGKNNSSFQLVNQINGNTFFLTNSFAGIKRDIDSLPIWYERVIMFGLDKTLQESIRFEKAAQKNGELLCTTMDITAYSRIAEQNNIPYTISERPTMYLCNEAYFLMLKKMKCPVLFIHIPSMPHMSNLFLDTLRDMFIE